jgi:ketosteroid isomerase-like protein
VPLDPEYSHRFLETISRSATKDERLSVLHAAFDAIIQGNFDAFGEKVTDDVELNISGFGVLDGSWRGRAEVIAASRKNFGQLGQQKPEIESIIAEGERIAVLLNEKGIFRSNGQPYSVRGVQWFTFAEGKIRKIDEIIAATS